MNQSSSNKSSNLPHDVTNVAYKMTSNKNKAKLEALIEKIRDAGWEILLKSVDDQDTKAFGYKAVALISKSTKEIHISSAGTKERIDLADNACVVLSVPPYKLRSMKLFVDKIVNEVTRIGENVKDYKFGTSEHSLGAILSDLTFVEIHSRGLKFDQSITFDNPGSKSIVQNTISQNCFSHPVTTTVDELGKRCVEYNARPNFINQANEHMATNTKVVIPLPDNKPSDLTISDKSSWLFAQYLYKKFGHAVGKCAEIFGITEIIKQLESHKMANINPAQGLVYETESAILVQNQVILSNKELVRLKNITSTGKEFAICEELESKEDGYVSVNWYNYSADDLAKAASCTDSQQLVIGQCDDDYVNSGYVFL